MTLLKVEHLTHRYGDVIALEDVTLEIPDGRVGLVGANGAGKTTLLRILLGMLHPDDIAETYFNIWRQNRSAWTWEVELRPWVEQF